MGQLWRRFQDAITPELITEVSLGLLILGIGWILARSVAALVSRFLVDRTSLHVATLVRRACFYGLFLVVLLTSLDQMGVDLTVMLGAASILTLAVGFASQTSVSNLISGLFLVGEQAIGIGDVIEVGSTTGEVVSIDLLSVKMRTFDNLYVRVPNELLIKSTITNLTRYPIRRIDVMVGVSYKESIEEVRSVLARVADDHPLVLTDPTPLILFKDYGESSLNFQFSVWTARENILAVRDTIREKVKIAFDEHGIEIPFPQRSIHTGSRTAPFPVRVVGDDPGATAHHGETPESHSSA